jgi:hypothetical protein
VLDLRLHQQLERGHHPELHDALREHELGLVVRVQVRLVLRWIHHDDLGVGGRHARAVPRAQLAVHHLHAAKADGERGGVRVRDDNIGQRLAQEAGEQVVLVRLRLGRLGGVRQGRVHADRENR